MQRYRDTFDLRKTKRHDCREENDLLTGRFTITYWIPIVRIITPLFRSPANNAFRNRDCRSYTRYNWNDRNRVGRRFCVKINNQLSTEHADDTHRDRLYYQNITTTTFGLQTLSRVDYVRVARRFVWIKTVRDVENNTREVGQCRDDGSIYELRAKTILWFSDGSLDVIVKSARFR